MEKKIPDCLLCGFHKIIIFCLYSQINTVVFVDNLATLLQCTAVVIEKLLTDLDFDKLSIKLKLCCILLHFKLMKKMEFVLSDFLKIFAAI